MFSDFNTAIKNTTALPLLGYFCGWSLCGGSAPQFRVDALLEQYGLKDDVPMPKCGPTTAYRRAVLDATRGGKGKRDEKMFETVKLEETERFITHAIVKREVLAGVETSRDATTGEVILAGDVDLKVEFRVGFDKEKRNSKSCPTEDLIQFDATALGHPMAKRIMDIYMDLAGVYKVEDLRFAFTKALETWRGMRAVPQGAMWFLPKQSEAKMRAWESLLKDLGHEPLVIPIFDTMNSRDQLRDIAASTLDGQLREMKVEISKYLDKGNTRESTLQSRVAKLDELRAKANLYKTLLGMEIEALDEGVEAAKTVLVEGIATLAK